MNTVLGITLSILLIILVASTTILMILNIISDRETNKIEKEIKEHYLEQIRNTRNSENNNK